jgi:hypothetical protein
MNWLVRALLLACLVAASACTMQGAIDRMSSPEDRAFAQHFVDAMRSGKAGTLKDRFDPELWEQSLPLFEKAQAAFPKGESRTRLISYQFQSNFTAGTRQTEFVLSTTDGRRWTRTNLVAFEQGGRRKVVGWHVEPFARPPPDLQMFETMNRILPWIQAIGIVVLLGVIGLLGWLFRRSRARRAGG